MIAGILSQAFGGPLASDRWIAFYGIHVRQLTLPQEGELGPDDTPIDQLRELDFLVFDRLRGFAVLEVKGGLLRSRKGVWERFGTPDPAEGAALDNGARPVEPEGAPPRQAERTWIPTRDPMEQARSAMNNLLRRLKERIGGNLFKGNPLWHSHAVLLPHVDATRGGLPTDWNKFVMATSDQLRDAAAFESWLEAHFEYTAKAHGKRTSERVTSLVARIIDDCIMPPFTGERTARKQIARMAEADRRTMDGATPIHEFVHSKVRRSSVLVEGAAGTGKTHAAVLRAMHELETKPDSKVLYVAFNELLAEQVASGPAARFGDRFAALSFRALCERECARAGVAWIAGNLQGDALTDFYRNQAPALLEEAATKAPLPMADRPAMIIIDEAQDFNERWLHAIEVLTGSDCIRWCLYDPAQLLFGNLSLDSSGGDSTETADDLAERLAKRFGKPDLMLRNQRLSGRVFEHLRSRGIIPHKESMLDPNALEGFETTEMQAARSYALKAVHHAILHAIDELQFAPDQILVQAAITPSNDEHPLFRPKGPWTGDGTDPWDVAGRFRLARIEDGDAMPDDAIEMATAQKFKGCERPYSIVIRTPSMDAARFYTACTRARLGLVIIDVVD
jgi:hypothetical protein